MILKVCIKVKFQKVVHQQLSVLTESRLRELGPDIIDSFQLSSDRSYVGAIRTDGIRNPGLPHSWKLVMKPVERDKKVAGTFC